MDQWQDPLQNIFHLFGFAKQTSIVYLKDLA